MKVREAKVEKGLFLPSLHQPAGDKSKTPKRRRTMSRPANLTPTVDREA